ncbi:MAG: hypothetical protein JW880_07520 [Candidatus Thermoplasmatota archaeon]|nr:hypothetical protein [Candidatus Thermoplasmatota archaeon]
MVGDRQTVPKDGSGLFKGWPEKTNRKLIAIVVVALLLGVPTLSMTIVSVHVDRQIIEIEPWSHRAFHAPFFGFGTFEYSYAGVSGSEVYILELNSVSYYRFVLDRESFDFDWYHRISSTSRGSASMGGLIWDSYVVLANNGGSTAYVEFELDGRAYMSLLPAAAILLTISAGAYWMGRQEDKKAHLDPVNPIVAARRLVRIKALEAMALLSLLPVLAILGVEAALQSTRMIWAAASYGFLIGVLMSVVLALKLRFRLTEDRSDPKAILRNLAYRLRISGYRVAEEEGRLNVQISSTSAVHIITREAPEGTRVLYKTSATPKGYSILIILFLTFVGMPLALPLALFMLYRSSVFASTRVLPRISQLPLPQAEHVRADTRTLIIESLSEGRRLSAEAYESTRSNYDDSLIIMAVVGLLLGTVVGLLAFTQIDSSMRGIISLVGGVTCAAVLFALSWRRISARSRPLISEFKGWAAKLDAALSREVSGQNPPDGDPSAFEMIADVFKEMPKWLKARRRAGGFRQPMLWILEFIVLYLAFNFGYMGLSLLSFGQHQTGALLLTASIVSVLLAFLLHRILKKRLDREYQSTLSWWNERSETLRSEMEKILVGE